MKVLKIQYKMLLYCNILLLQIKASFKLIKEKAGKTHLSVLFKGMQYCNFPRIQLIVFKAMIWALVTYSVITVYHMLLIFTLVPRC